MPRTLSCRIVLRQRLDGYLEGLDCSISAELDWNCLTGFGKSHCQLQLAALCHRLAIEFHDHITALDPGFGCGAVRGNISH
ncbi:hypothetical protein SDC9_160190 [bioreactor metagenome]|uniref:Uncharacterized protein n=1 Tax=bioreactor metagenome TaxID=1076179 RepID=A0A645FFZ5_9ZZZZ